MLNLVAIYKTYDGEDWLQASLTSIYEGVSKIYVFDSTVSWLGERDNSVGSVLREFIDVVDVNHKITIVPYDSTNEEKQYRYAINYVTQDADFDYLLVVDSDELWNPEELQMAAEFIEDDGGQAYKVALRTYIKSPFYMIEPTEPCHPCAFVRRGVSMPGVRGNKTRGMKLIPGVYLHHYTAVRATEEAIARKIRQSNRADGQRAVDVDEWMRTVWDRLPEGSNLHYTAGFEDAWKGVRVIGEDELPKILRLQDHPLVTMWQHTRKVTITQLPIGELVYDDEVVLRTYARGRRNAVDLGTFLGRAAIIISEQAQKVTTIDVFERIDLIDEPSWQEHYKKLYQRSPHPYETVKQTLSQWKNITVVAGLTYEPVADNVDFLFIDADHSRSGVERDFFAYLPRLVSGALVLFHDSVDSAAPVNQFIIGVIEPRPDFERVDEGGSITVWRYTGGSHESMHEGRD